MKEKQKREMKGEEILKDSLKCFERQYNAKLGWTGYSYTDKDEDGIILNQEYMVNDFVLSKAEDVLAVEIGGLFSYDDRNSETRIYCLLGVKVNGRAIGKCEAIQGEYDSEKKRWWLYRDTY